MVKQEVYIVCNLHFTHSVSSYIVFCYFLIRQDSKYVKVQVEQ